MYGTLAHGFHLLRDGDAWCAVGPDFLNLQRSPAGFGATRQEAIRALRADLRVAGYSHYSLPSLGEFTIHDE